MLKYYIGKSNYKIDELLSLSFIEKLFYTCCMEIEIEEENEKYRTMFGTK